MNADGYRKVRYAERLERFGAQATIIFPGGGEFSFPRRCQPTGAPGRGAALSHLGYLSVTRPKSYHLRKL